MLLRLSTFMMEQVENMTSLTPRWPPGDRAGEQVNAEEKLKKKRNLNMNQSRPPAGHVTDRRRGGRERARVSTGENERRSCGGVV